MTRSHRAGRMWAWLTSAALVATACLAASPAMADTAPSDPALPATVSADSMPTVQINGVVWNQQIVGSRVYVAGNFTKARPAGAAAGTSEVDRPYMLAYDLRTGVLVSSFAPAPNAQVRDLALSPDGKRLYAVGNFTTIAGATRYRIAAFDTATGALVATFKPIINAPIQAVTATNNAVVIGGSFTSVNGVTRTKLAALDATTGATLAFNPTFSDGSVTSAVFSPTGDSVAVGGSFTSVNGSSDPGYGLARLSLQTSALLPLSANTQIRNGGAQSAILSLESDADYFYGTGYHFGGGGNVEGTFAVSWLTGSLVWVEDCHGDTYSAFPVGDVIYAASHKHYCGNSAGFPQTDPWTFHRATAVTKAVRGTNTADIYGYPDHVGQPRPEILNWYPEVNTGTFTGKNQGPWTMSGNSQYVLMGGEFTRVNNGPQQGLARFAVSTIAPNKEGPKRYGSTFPITAKSFVSGSVRLAWSSNYDYDNETLTYAVYRQSTATSPIYKQTVTTPFWKPQTMTFTDTGLTPGSSQRYRLVATDPFGNTAQSDWTTVTVSAGVSLSPYASAVMNDNATNYWRLDEPSGPTVYDWSGLLDATAGSGVTLGAAGAISGDSDSSAQFDGSGSGLVATNTAVTGPQTFAIEAWFKTTSTAGGKIVGFGNANTGDSSNYDRHVYMGTDGKVNFGVYPGDLRVLSSGAAYNDGRWHLVTASLGADGMKLYVDGGRVAQRSDTTSAQSYSGFWRIGGDSTWSGAPYFAGTIDDVSIYAAPLTATQVNNHWIAAGGSSTIPAAPADAYGAAVYNLSPDLYWRLGESSGTTAVDSGTSGNVGTYSGGVTKGAVGALSNVNNAAASFNGSDGLVASVTPTTGPSTYSEELWFKTTTGSGGKLIGFGSSATGTSGAYDRHVYMENSGQLTFGVWTGQTNTITTPDAYNDGTWHHMVATQSSAGLALYVDGQLRGTNPQTGAQDYSGYWRVGGDTTWGPQPWFSGTLDEVAVYSTALTQVQVQQHWQLGGGTAPNQPPVAAFTTSTSALAVSVDGSGSSDPDGTVSSYAWTFGDAGTATGATASHTYAAAGTYAVTLTVTDNGGASTSTTKQVTIASAPNQPPVAAFTTSTSALAVSVDGSGSSDPDGTVSSYAWTFGDAGTATGATASHTYAAAGTYAVTLTVTDNGGASTSTTKQVTIAAPPAPGALASDSFARTVASGWGTAETGGAWTQTGTASRFSVDGSSGVHQVVAGATAIGSALTSVSSASADTAVTLSPSKIPGGGGAWITLLGRVVGADSYAARVRLQADGTVQLHALRGATPLQGGTVSGLTYAAGDRLRLRIQVIGTSPTTIRAKVWKEGDAEPAAWRVSILDTTAALQTAGSIAVASYLFGTATNGPLTIGYDNLVSTEAML